MIDVAIFLCVFLRNLCLSAVVLTPGIFLMGLLLGAMPSPASINRVCDGDSRRLICGIRCAFAVYPHAFGHKLRIVRVNQDWLERYYDGCNQPYDHVIATNPYHTVCETCGLQYDWTSLGPLSPLEQLALADG